MGGIKCLVHTREKRQRAPAGKERKYLGGKAVSFSAFLHLMQRRKQRRKARGEAIYVWENEDHNWEGDEQESGRSITCFGKESKLLGGPENTEVWGPTKTKGYKRRVTTNGKRRGRMIEKRAGVASEIERGKRDGVKKLVGGRQKD